jgi:hypothetical protein
METVTIRVFETDLIAWKRKSNLRGLSVSEWIRRQCNEAQTISEQVNGPGPESERSNGSETNQNVSRAPRDSSTRRRVASAGRRSSPPGTYSYPRRVDSSPVEDGNRGSVETTTAVVVPSVVAESVPVQKVIHTATSNRLTCLCNTCTLYRKNNSLPIGGLPKKEKAR